MLYLIPKTIAHRSPGESLGFMAVLGVHLLVYFGLYLLASAVAAKLIFLLRSPRLRAVLVGTIGVGLGALAFLPIYGGSGHGPMRWTTLPTALAGIDQSYGPGTVAAVYGAAALVATGIWLYARRRASGPPRQPGGGEDLPPASAA